LKSHKISHEEYVNKFPEAKLISEETSKKYSENSKKQNLTRDYTGNGEKISKTKKKMFAIGELVQWNTGIAMSNEQKKKLSNIVKAQYASGKRIHPMKHMFHTEETKRLISEKCKGYKLTDDQRQKYLNSMQRVLTSPDYIPPMKGKFHSLETKKKISETNKNNYDKTRAIMEAKGHWIPLDQLDDFVIYKRLVWAATNKNVHMIPDYDINKRGLCKLGSDNYQVDHIVSITNGFKQGIDPEIIGSTVNLRFISWQENLQKSDRSDMSIEELYEIFEGIL
jgi:hypothetical protein